MYFTNNRNQVVISISLESQRSLFEELISIVPSHYYVHSRTQLDNGRDNCDLKETTKE